MIGGVYYPKGGDKEEIMNKEEFSEESGGVLVMRDFARVNTNMSIAFRKTAK
jgi:hypothetical protein